VICKERQNIWVIVELEFNSSHRSANWLFFRDEAIRTSGMPMTKNSMEMENHVFQKAKSKVSSLCIIWYCIDIKQGKAFHGINNNMVI
jgi:hypothetical protein